MPVPDNTQELINTFTKIAESLKTLAEAPNKDEKLVQEVDSAIAKLQATSASVDSRSSESISKLTDALNGVVAKLK